MTVIINIVPTLSLDDLTGKFHNKHKKNPDLLHCEWIIFICTFQGAYILSEIQNN